MMGAVVLQFSCFMLLFGGVGDNLLQPLIHQNQQIWATLKQARDMNADAIKANNHGIHANKKAEKNLKAVNEIYFETIAKGIFEYDQNQTQKLHHIALQCPLDGGIAVYKARSMVMFFTKVDYETLQDCSDNGHGNGNGNGNARMATITPDTIKEKNGNVKLYPNPASENFIIEWQVENSETGKLLLK